VIQVFGAVYGLINFSTNASPISNDVAFLSGTATEYLVSRHWIVSIYEFSLSVVRSDPTISIDTLSNAVPGVSVSTMDCRVLTRTNVLVGGFVIPVYTVVLPTSYLTKNNCDGVFYMFL
jgi:hypothetical protein